MGYIQDLEKDLRQRLDSMDQEELVKFFKEKVLESYRNGMDWGAKNKKGEKTPRTQAKGYGQA